jgi:tetratricopeptide (TPR) repeat protein
MEPRLAGPPAEGTADHGVPDAARRLYESGGGLLREGKPAEALAALDAALAAHPEYAEAHDRAGLALRDLGRHEESLRRFERAIDLRHDFEAAIVHQGIACLELQRYEDAEDCFKLALARDQGSADLWTHLAMACWNQGRKGEAIAHFRRALGLDGTLADVHLFLAGLLHDEGLLEEAAESYRRGLALKPDVPELHANYGLTLLKLHRADEAAAHLEKAVALRPDFAEAYFGLGNARWEQQRDDDAQACFERALELRPDYGDAYVNLASVLKDRGEVGRALEYYRKAQLLNPDAVEPHHNMGVVLNLLGRPRDAIACYEEAQRIRPGHPDSLLNLAIARLQVGDLQRGWQDYDCRFRQTNPELGTRARAFSHPVWAGEPLAGRRILIWGEQGIGDEILFSAMYAEIVAAARVCVIECAPKLVRLFARSFPGARVVARSDPPHSETAQDFDFQSSAGSLARWLRPDLASFPAHSGHLAAAPERVARWRDRLAGLGPGLKVGFSWRSNNLKGERALACTRIEQWQPVFAVRGVHFVNLQYDDCRAELDNARQAFGVALNAFPEVDLFNDLDEAAALTQALDIVISAPTAVSLLSAALGVPTWQMSYGADWQVHGSDRNPWFPAMTQFKRAWNEEWGPILLAMAVRLRELAGQPLEPDVGAPLPGMNMDGGLARAHALLRENRLLEARVQFEQVLAGEPQSAQDWLGRARALRALDRLQEAAECAQRSLDLDPGLAEAALELGIARYYQGRIEDADAAYGRVLELDPRHLAARVNRALAGYERGDLDAAIVDYEAVLRDRPDDPAARFNLGLALLARGDLARGWEEYEWRFDQATLEDRNRSFPFPRWMGQDLAGKTVLAWKEQSVGSQLLFAGALPELIARAGYCIVECTPKLVPLFARSFPDCDIVPRTDPPHPYTQHAIDFQVPMCSLGRWLRRSPDEFPSRESYLAADEDRVDYWRDRLSQLGAGPKIGFSWRSIDTSGARSLACTLIEQWAPVLAGHAAAFVSLQYDECSDELERARRELGVPIHEPGGIDMFNDLDDVAALMRSLDLVISAPTAVSVLSAALGVPTWQLHHGMDWQMHGQPRHPWLRSLRRFQRSLHQPWEEVMRDVAAELERWLAARGSRRA